MSNLNIDLNRVGAKGALAEEADGKWGMVIDQDICTGCQACVAACAMENNIPFVMEEDAAYGRTLHWIRIERFWEGEYPEIRTTPYQPMLCQQCGSAPCEPVCPVFASVHSQSQELNLQVYNRCIGTRYCANNCPYQVRTFNWRDYAFDVPRQRLEGSLSLPSQPVQPGCDRCAANHGKVHFCIQRSTRRRTTPSRKDAPVEDGEFTTACAACLTNAITFWSDDPKPGSQLANCRTWLTAP
jgi:molybdopterin-containing oxidoreductase family iron-sulfur binding subunit